MLVPTVEPDTTPAERYRNEVAARIRKARARSGMSQLALAEAIGVTQSAVALWENAKTTPRLNLHAAIARALGVQQWRLFKLPTETEEVEGD